MFRKNIQQIAEALSLNWSGEGSAFPNRIVFDSRSVKEGDIFVTIKGEKVDGSDYIQQAIDNGAVAIVTDADKMIPQRVDHIHCDDGVYFIQALAKWMRSLYKGTIIAITGSQGKTSTKDFLTQILKRKYSIVVTSENQNNELGLPLTMTKITEDTEVCVLEMGMTGFDEIDFLANIAKPHHAIITNIGTVHAELLGSREGIARAKTELLKYLPKNGILSLRKTDYGILSPYLSETEATIIWTKLGICPEKSCLYAQILDESEEGIRFKCYQADKEVCCINLPFAGRHQVENALLTIAIAQAMNVPMNQIEEALNMAKSLSSDRMEIMKIEERTLINDTYNANPESMIATISVLGKYENIPRVACLGGMYELGQYEKKAHKQVGEYLVQESIEQLICVGEKALMIAEGAREAGMDDSKILLASSNVEAVNYIRQQTPLNAVVLVKGSHGLNMVQIINSLR